MKKFEYTTEIQKCDKNGFIIDRKPGKSGILYCEYIPEIFTYQKVYTQLDLKGPIFVYDNCRLLKDFGPFEENEEFKSILLDYNVDEPHIIFEKNKNQSIYLNFKNIE